MGANFRSRVAGPSHVIAGVTLTSPIRSSGCSPNTANTSRDLSVTGQTSRGSRACLNSNPPIGNSRWPESTRKTTSGPPVASRYLQPEGANTGAPLGRAGSSGCPNTPGTGTPTCTFAWPGAVLSSRRSWRKAWPNCSSLERLDLDVDDPAWPVLLAVSDNDPSRKPAAAKAFMLCMAIVQNHGRPHSPTDRAPVETFFGHVKAKWPRLEGVDDAELLEHEFERVPPSITSHQMTSSPAVSKPSSRPVGGASSDHARSGSPSIDGKTATTRRTGNELDQLWSHLHGKVRYTSCRRCAGAAWALAARPVLCPYPIDTDANHDACAEPQGHMEALRRDQ